MDNLLRSEVKLRIDHRFDDFMKPVHIFSVFIQFYCADFNDLKRKSLNLPVLAIGALIPFQIKHNIIHTVLFPSDSKTVWQGIEHIPATFIVYNISAGHTTSTI